ncbi:MAG: alanine racemase [Lachnospiraceae bacterium]|nr:alanine racemase [Lachnospiraceae bacterium]MDD3615892.1 alanine racemase [Lachnospiraceae bacterium]
MKKHSRVYAKIDLDAVAYNFEQMKKNLAENTSLIAVVKADGYGHGAVPIAKVVEPYDYIWGFATATVEEAVELREQKIKKPILILGYTFEEDYETIVRNHIRPAVFKMDMAEALSKVAQTVNETVYIHIALDTGMSRIGFADVDSSIETIKEIAKLPNIVIEGMFTHFSKADETDTAHAVNQFTRYMSFAEKLEQAGIHLPIRHCSNSAGIIRLPQAHLDIARAGITIYGLYPSQEVEKDIVLLKPVMSIHSHISYVKELDKGAMISYGGTYITTQKTRVATIPVGYADGYPRQLSNKGYVLIHDKKAPILGRVCMDQFMVDVTDIPNAQDLDPVILVGQGEKENISVEELGDLSGRFNYEFVCDINKRVPRIYQYQGKIWE